MVMRRRRRKRAHTNHQHLMWRSCCRLPNQVVHCQQGCPGEEFRKLITPSEDPWLLGSVEAGWSSDDGTLLVEKGKDTKHVKRLIHSPVNRHTAAVEDPGFTLEEKPCDNELRPIIMKLAVIYCKSKNSLLALERMRRWFVVRQCFKMRQWGG